MRIRKLSNRLLLSAVVISTATALAYMSAVSLVISTQYREQSRTQLRQAAAVISEELTTRQNGLLDASRHLAAQHNLGTTIWYLSQYAGSELDRETLQSTYRQLAQEVQEVRHTAHASSIAIYDAAGHLISFSRIDGRLERTGFVEREPAPRLMMKEGTPDGDNRAVILKPTPIPPSIRPEFGQPLPQKEDAHYALIDDELSIEINVPIMDPAHDGITGKTAPRQVGLIAMTHRLDRGFVHELARRTDTDINVFTTDSLRHGTLTAYLQPDWSGQAPPAHGAAPALALNEISIDGTGYYQGLIPLYREGQPIGSIAALRSKSVVETNTWEMIRILGLIAAAIMAFVLPLAWYFSTSISRPLTTLSRIFRGVTDNTNAIVQDDELLLLDKTTLDYELADLTQSFIAMNDAVSQKIRQINDINASLENTVNERTAALIAKEQESRTLIENSPDSIARYDRDCRRIFANPAFCSTVGLRLEALLGKRPSEVPGGSNAEIYEAKIHEVLSGSGNTQFELKWHSQDGREHCTLIHLAAEADVNGTITSVLAVGRDISDRIAFEETIWKQANFDSLTQLPNRQLFHDRLEHESRLADRSGRSMVLMLIDLDHFKEVNDSLGHDKGDVLLIEAGRRIGACVRASDTVARLGGDEFTVILSCVDDMESVERIAHALIDKLSSPFVLGADKAFVSASLGITLYPSDARELDILFKNADQAMYAAKNAGRNRFSYFTPDLHEAAQKRQHLSSDLRTALANGEFRIFYQPIVELTSSRVCKAEALIRWAHPQRGLTGPLEFIPVAEETGLIVPIGEWVFKQAAQQARNWCNRFDSDFQISINTSPAQIRHDGNALAHWPEYLAEQGIPGHSVVIEITESLLLHAEARINKKLLGFRDAGIQVAIDDFGTGYSSLAYLKRFHIDYLKIDRSFVRNLGCDANDRALCEAIIVMAHALGLKVVAEGVETTIQRDLLVAAGCDYAQGFLYSPALTSAEFERWAWSVNDVAA
ncbi:bifunctional diguanylate cyclase/phosphodiesterase [Zoogloea sp. LCSB751]|uniref:putative bifunctional diguanylate cyclase/phosphodiesterase n=1 Tax=Zoogloea sp. LCSB751 TaxID=1965277 RepID=UPI001C1F99C1|nr:EAL domain-containing protein [Zoogloea sp. LCSB751]